MHCNRSQREIKLLAAKIPGEKDSDCDSGMARDSRTGRTGDHAHTVALGVHKNAKRGWQQKIKL